MTNSVRGEVAFTAGDRTFVLRPTFEALCAIEDRLDTGVIVLAERIAQRRHGVRDIGAVLFEAAHAADPTVSQAEIEAAVTCAGLRAATLAALGLLACALGGPDPEKKAGQPAPPATP